MDTVNCKVLNEFDYDETTYTEGDEVTLPEAVAGEMSDLGFVEVEEPAPDPEDLTEAAPVSDPEETPVPAPEPEPMPEPEKIAKPFAVILPSEVRNGPPPTGFTEWNKDAIEFWLEEQGMDTSQKYGYGGCDNGVRYTGVKSS